MLKFCGPLFALAVFLARALHLLGADPLRSGLATVSGCTEAVTVWRAMRAHASQFVWCACCELPACSVQELTHLAAYRYRRLFVLCSQYTFINYLRCAPRQGKRL